MDYSCAKFGDFSFGCFRFIVLTDRQTDRNTDGDDRYTHAKVGHKVTKCKTYLMRWSGRREFALYRVPSV